MCAVYSCLNLTGVVVERLPCHNSQAPVTREGGHQAYGWALSAPLWLLAFSPPQFSLPCEQKCSEPSGRTLISNYLTLIQREWLFLPSCSWMSVLLVFSLASIHYFIHMMNTYQFNTNHILIFELWLRDTSVIKPLKVIRLSTVN